MGIFEIAIIVLVLGVVVGSIAKFLLGRGFVEWFVFGAACFVGAAPILLFKAIRSPQPGASTRMGVAAIIAVALAFVGGVAYDAMPRFSQADIESVKAEIKREFEKRPGVKVKEVTMIKTEAKKISGFTQLDVNGVAVSRLCEATMAEDGANYIWKCQ